MIRRATSKDRLVITEGSRTYHWPDDFRQPNGTLGILYFNPQLGADPFPDDGCDSGSSDEPDSPPPTEDTPIALASASPEMQRMYKCMSERLRGNVPPASEGPDGVNTVAPVQAQVDSNPASQSSENVEQLTTSAPAPDNLSFAAQEDHRDIDDLVRFIEQSGKKNGRRKRRSHSSRNSRATSPSHPTPCDAEPDRAAGGEQTHAVVRDSVASADVTTLEVPTTPDCVDLPAARDAEAPVSATSSDDESAKENQSPSDTAASGRRAESKRSEHECDAEFERKLEAFRLSCSQAVAEPRRKVALNMGQIMSRVQSRRGSPL